MHMQSKHMVLLASRGYLVAAPDYIGLDGDGPEDQRNPLHHWYEGTEALSEVFTETVASHLKQAQYCSSDPDAP